MNDEARFLMSLWESLSDYISQGEKQEAAEAIIKIFVEEGYELDTLYDADGECPYIDRALSSAQLDDEYDDVMEEEEY